MALRIPGIDIPALPGWADVWRPALRALTKSEVKDSLALHAIICEALRSGRSLFAEEFGKEVADAMEDAAALAG
jgi:hypothetical protein